MSKSMPQGLKEESPASYERYLGWICFQKCRKLVRKTNKFGIISNCSAWFSPNLCIFVCVCSIYIYIHSTSTWFHGACHEYLHHLMFLPMKQAMNFQLRIYLWIGRVGRPGPGRAHNATVRDVQWWYGSSLVRYLFHGDVHPKKNQNQVDTERKLANLWESKLCKYNLFISWFSNLIESVHTFFVGMNGHKGLNRKASWTQDLSTLAPVSKNCWTGCLRALVFDMTNSINKQHEN